MIRLIWNDYSDGTIGIGIEIKPKPDMPANRYALKPKVPDVLSLCDQAEGIIFRIRQLYGQEPTPEE